jgi:hypothetical protein
MVLSAKYNRLVNTRDMARALGRRGGRARARRLSVQDRKRIAGLGGRARLDSLRAARRVTENLHYAAALVALRGPAPEVTSLRTFAGPLPGLYPAKR